MEPDASANRIKRSEAREIIRRLNRMDLDRADYEEIKKLIGRLISGIPVHVDKVRNDARLYRGVLHEQRPLDRSLLSYPPASTVTNFQRCNPPNRSMFYCSPTPAAAFYELDVHPGDRIYLSKWSISREFLLQKISRSEDEDLSPPTDSIFTYFETKFSQPIHDTYSSQYKITAAITEVLTLGKIEVPDGSMALGGLLYPSVAHPGRPENLAIRPDVVDRCLNLDYVEEIQITDRKEDANQTITYNRIDVSSDFSNGEIRWSGRPLHWNAGPGPALITFTNEPDGWIARDARGNIINPG